MADLTFAEIANLGKERVAEKVRYSGENNTPLWDHFNAKKKQPIDEQGKRFPIITVRPGGHNLYTQGASSFRAPVPLDSDSMRVYPIWYQIGHTIQGASLRALKRGGETQLLDFRRDVGNVTDAAKKRLNQLLHGDGSAVLAVCSNTAINGTGSKTLTAMTLASSAGGEAETKGTSRLEKGHVYHLVDTDGVTINAIFTVTTPGKLTCVVNVTTSSATSASGDFVVDAGYTTTVNSYRKAMAGLRSLCAASGVVQNVSRAAFTEFVTPRVNANDLPITPYVFSTAKTYVNIGSNDMNEASGKLIVMTPGQEMMLRVQQFGYRQYDGNANVKGVAGKYQDADGDTYLYDADGAEDRIYILDDASFYLGEEKPFGVYDEDGNELRMQPGSASVGSDAFYMAIGWGGNLIKDVSSSTMQKDAYIDRLSQTDAPGQTSF